jgi:hypothetical protein
MVVTENSNRGQIEREKMVLPEKKAKGAHAQKNRD